MCFVMVCAAFAKIYCPTQNSEEAANLIAKKGGQLSQDKAAGAGILQGAFSLPTSIFELQYFN